MRRRWTRVLERDLHELAGGRRPRVGYRRGGCCWKTVHRWWRRWHVRPMLVRSILDHFSGSRSAPLVDSGNLRRSLSPGLGIGPGSDVLRSCWSRCRILPMTNDHLVSLSSHRLGSPLRLDWGQILPLAFAALVHVRRPGRRRCRQLAMLCLYLMWLFLLDMLQLL